MYRYRDDTDLHFYISILRSAGNEQECNLLARANFISLLNGNHILVLTVAEQFAYAYGCFDRLARKLGGHLTHSALIYIVMSFICIQYSLKG